MPQPRIKLIFVNSAGEPNDRHRHARKTNAVIWIPDSALTTLNIRFTGTSPFNASELQAPGSGGCVGALVVGPPGTYRYHLTAATLSGQILESDPEIIIDTGSGVPGGEKSGGKGARKTGGTRKRGGVKKKGGKKKSAKRR